MAKRLAEMTAPAQTKMLLAQTEAERMKRIRHADQDHYGRTRQSFIVDGVEHGKMFPTAQTESKLKQSTLTKMFENRNLSPEQIAAAMEIASVYQSLVARLFCRAAAMGERVNAHRPTHETALDRLHSSNYLPWATYLGGRADHGKHDGIPVYGVEGRCPVALELTIDVVVDGMSLDECERLRHWRKKGTAGELLGYALMVYTDIAGWERCRGRIADFEERLARRRVPLNQRAHLALASGERTG